MVYEDNFTNFWTNIFVANFLLYICIESIDVNQGLDHGLP